MHDLQEEMTRMRMHLAGDGEMRAAVDLAECEECHALVRAEKMPAHERWHGAQQDQWHEVWTGEKR